MKSGERVKVGLHVCKHTSSIASFSLLISESEVKVFISSEHLTQKVTSSKTSYVPLLSAGRTEDFMILSLVTD